MLTKQNITVYQCEHCKKKLFRKHSMELHEKWCTYNPDNFVKCSGCHHLEVVPFEWSLDYGAEYTCSDLRTSNSFRCKVKGVEMYPVSALKKNLPTKYPHDFKNKILMPTECDIYDDIPF